MSQMSTGRSGIPRQLTATAPLSAAEELALAREHVRSRSPAGAHRLVCSHLRLVLKIAREYRVPAHAELSDVVQDGTLGLLEAVRRFDPERGVRLFNYASWWIRACILRGIVNTAEIVCSGRGRQGRRDFFAGRRPLPALSLDAPAASGSDTPLLALLPAKGTTPADQALERAELAQMVGAVARTLADALPDRERAVLDARPLADEPVTLPHLAAVSR
jgi:RNA polymerase sigma factor (sigma-70 family)